MPLWGCHATGNSSSPKARDAMADDGPCTHTSEWAHAGKRRGTCGRERVRGSYKMITHEERIGIFSRNRVGEALFHGERLVPRGKRGCCGHALEHAHCDAALVLGNSSSTTRFRPLFDANQHQLQCTAAAAHAACGCMCWDTLLRGGGGQTTARASSHTQK